MAWELAVRKNTKVLIGMTGQSGLGKTYSALLLARGLVGPQGKIGFLDTEQGRGAHYSDLTKYYRDDLCAPFSPARYRAAIQSAYDEGFDCLIIDSLSHEWENVGGVLEMADSNGKKGQQKWLIPKTEHRRFMNLLLRAPMHVIICMRGKEKLVQVGNEFVSQGTIPIQEKRLLYEMTISLLFEEGHEAGVPIIKKCPAAMLNAFPAKQKVSVNSGAIIAQWAGSGVAADPVFEALKTEGHQIALDGTDALKTWFEALPAAKKKLIEALKNNELKVIAKDVDDSAALNATGDEEEEAANSDVLNDPAPAQPEPAETAPAKPARSATLNTLMERIRACDSPSKANLLRSIEKSCRAEIDADPEVRAALNAALAKFPVQGAASA